MGFVSRNLEDAKGSNCHAGNFCKTLGLLAQGMSLSFIEKQLELNDYSANNAPDLIDYGREELDKDYAALIQAFSRFLLDRLLSEGTVHSHHPRLLKSRYSNMSPPPPITQLTGINMRAINACSICSSARERTTSVNIIELMYPRQPGPDSDFTAVLRDSLVREIGHKANCATCKRLVPHTSRRVFKAQDLPPVLVVHACVSTTDQLSIWKDQRKSTFLRPTVTIKGNGEEENGDEVTYVVRVSSYFTMPEIRLSRYTGLRDSDCN
jgi:PAB-dependent poly(A)-specific ribonuclease subunit 2